MHDLESQENEFRELRKSVSEAYKPKRLHPEIFTLQEEYLDVSFLHASKSSSIQERLAILTKETETGTLQYLFTHFSGIYSFNLFTKEFCEKLIEEIENFQVTHFKYSL